MMTTKELRLQFETETKESWMTGPVCHGEFGFASWNYQKWLEQKSNYRIKKNKYTESLREHEKMRDEFLDATEWRFICRAGINRKELK